MSILRIGKLIDPQDYYKYIEASKDLPEVVHKYGTPFNIPDTPCWMSYVNELGVPGKISYTRHTHAHPILGEMTQKIIEIFRGIMPESMLDPIRVHILRTQGSIHKHIDEAGRLACINIGLYNSSGAKTHTSKNQTYESFDENHDTIILEDGIGYLLDTNEFHSVEGISDSYRYLITYGFGIRFDDLKNQIKILV